MSESRQLDGVNILPHLRGDAKTPPHDVLFWRRGGGDSYAVRRGAMKLTEQTRGEMELYNLADDIGEQNDLAGEKSALLKELDSWKQKWNADLVPPKWQSPRAGQQRKKN